MSTWRGANAHIQRQRRGFGDFTAVVVIHHGLAGVNRDVIPGLAPGSGFRAEGNINM